MARDYDHDGVPALRDCNDEDPDVYPGAREHWYDGVDQDCDGHDDRDADGDGYPWEPGGTLDCDDGRADVNPGAAETWYDSVDQDCSGGSDYDADGDGTEAKPWGRDCDDADPDIAPTVHDTWYDGIDSDCDGADDYDRDQDGHRREPEGDDCDDTDPTTHPGQTEVWYDGVDQDCDGNDADQDGDGQDATELGGPDCDDLDPRMRAVIQYVDADGDGAGDPATEAPVCPPDPDLVLIGGDCDDSDPDVRPGATDTWYDGVDSDCAGDDDFDQDLDGYSAFEHGGTDCDDTDPTVTERPSWTDADGDGFGEEDVPSAICGADGTVYTPWDCDDTDPSINPAATEIGFDGIDQDCDGSAADEIEALSGLAFGGASAGDELGRGIAEVDLDGDGEDDLVVGSPGALGPGSWTGETHVVLSPVTSANFIGTTSIVIPGSSGGGQAGWSVLGGDFDGDGTAVLVMASPGTPDVSWTPDGEVELWEVSSPGGTSLATLRPEGSTDLPGWALAAMDQDGDGSEELYVSAPGAARVYGLSEPLAGSLLSDAEVVLEGGSSLSDAGASLLGTADWDGDGVPDLAVGSLVSSGTVSVLSSPVESGSLDAAEATWTGEQSGEEAGAALSDPGDLDGDGLVDLLVGAPLGEGDEASAGRVYLLLDPLAGGDLADAEGVWLGGTTGDELGASVALASGDSSTLLVLGAPGAVSGAGAVFLVVDPEAGTWSVATEGHEMSASHSNDELGISLLASGEGSSGAFWVGASTADVGAAGAGSVYQVGAESLPW